MKALEGTGVALVTPFKDGVIDFEAHERILEFVIKGGVDYVVSLGTTGESVTLSPEEQQDVLAFSSEKIADRVPLVAGNFGGNNTAALKRKILEFDLKGICALLSSSPAYNKPTQEGIYRHYMALDRISPLPLIVYNVPGRTASNVTAETTLRLAHDGTRIVAIKEASADLSQGRAILAERPKDFLVLSGDDPSALDLMEIGGDGVISVIANAFPKVFSQMTRLALSADIEQARILDQVLGEMHPLLYAEGNPTGIKAALHILGLCEMDVRLPLVAMSEDGRARLASEMRRCADLLQLADSIN